MYENQNAPVCVKQKQPRNLRRAAAAVGAGSTFVLATSANAAMDVAGLVTNISDQVGNIETIGMAILGVLVVIAGISLLRRIVK